MTSPIPSSSDPTSSSASVASEDLDIPAIKCSLCHEMLTAPKVLHCLHTFCEACLQKQLVVPEKISCPSCQDETFLGASGLSVLFPDFAAANLIEDIKIESETLKCTSCSPSSGMQSNPAVSKCVTCTSECYLCATCTSNHAMPHYFPGHKVVALTEVQTSHKDSNMRFHKVVNCLKHKNEMLLYYCETCDVPICQQCNLLDHSQDHDCVHLNEFAGVRGIGALSDLSSEARVKSTDLGNSLRHIDVAMNNLQSQYSKARTDIEDTFKLYMSVLEERKQESVKELDASFNGQQSQLKNLSDKVLESTEKLQHGCEFIDKQLKYCATTEILLFKKPLESRINNIMAYSPDAGLAKSDLQFVSNADAIVTGVRNTFGYVRQKEPDFSKPAPPSQGFSSLFSNQGTSVLGGMSSTSTMVPANYCNSEIGSESIATLTNNGLNGNSLGYGSGYESASNYPSSSSLATLNSLTDSFFSAAASNSNPYGRWSNGGVDHLQNTAAGGDVFSTASDPVMDLTSKLITANIYPPKSQIKRHKMTYHCKFGEFGVSESQFTEPSGVAVNKENDIIVADTNNHRIQIFDKEGRFKFQFGECGKRDGQLLYPNRVAVVRVSGDIVVTERSPTHQVQIYNQYGQFVRKFGANILQHPRGVAIDGNGRIVIIECKVMRVIIFDTMGNVLNKFSCSKYLEFPNGVVVNDVEEIFISDNRAHCVKVFNYQGLFLRQIGGEGITNYPIGVGINRAGEVLIADNHNNFNLTVFTQSGDFITALESKVKHAQCFDVALMDEGSIALASKDYRLYVYRYAQTPCMNLNYT